MIGVVKMSFRMSCLMKKQVSPERGCKQWGEGFPAFDSGWQPSRSPLEKPLLDFGWLQASKNR